MPEGMKSEPAREKLPLTLSERLPIGAAVACLIAAAAFLLTGQTDAAFVAATLGVVAWFINLRIRLNGERGAVDISESENPEQQDYDNES